MGSMNALNMNTIPATPGIYLFKNADGHIIYVGKAKVLRKRLASYFRPESALTPKTRAMMRKAASVDTISTTSEKEALLLEASLIKKHRPRYNIVLRDDKQYILFKLTKRQEWPRLTLTRKVVRDGSAYYGPYTSAQAARDTWKAIHGLFKLRRCSDKAFRNRVRPCLYHYIGQCLGPCCLPVDNALYKEQVGKVELLLSGHSTELVELLQAQMLEASENLAFEQAAVLRDQITSITRTVEKQAAVLAGSGDADIIGIADTGKGLALGLMFVRGGILLDKRHFFWGGLSFEEAPETLMSFLAQFYGPQAVIPGRIIIPWMVDWQDTDTDDGMPGAGEQIVASHAEDCRRSGEVGCEAQGMPVCVTDEVTCMVPEDGVPGTSAMELSCGDAAHSQSSDISGATPLEALAEALAELRGGPVRIGVPRNETENRLVSMAQTNAVEAQRASREQDAGALLAARLGLPAAPQRVEAVDVSHTGGRDTRVGVVVFENGRPAKDQYRTYAFSDEEAGGDDYGVLARWMERRLESGPPWPDLLLVDGGRGQLGAVMAVLREQGMDTAFAVASIAKARTEDGTRADRRKGNVGDSIFLPGRSNPVSMRPGSPELLLLQLMRDTVHDYSIRRHRKARAGTALAGELQRIPGIGPATAKLLWQHYPTIRDMALATEQELAAIPGIGPTMAQRIHSGLAPMRSVDT